MPHTGENLTAQRPEVEAFERCLVRALPPKSRFHFLTPHLYLKKRDRWLHALPGFLLLICALFVFYKTLQPTLRTPCDYSIPGLHTLPEETQHLFHARRALTVSDTSPYLQKILATYRRETSETAMLLRFYLIYDPILNPNHLAGLPASEQLRSRVRDGLDDLTRLPVSEETRAALTAKLLTAQWILTGTDADLSQAWDATDVSILRPTLDRLDLQLFILHRLLDKAPLIGAICFRGAKRPRHAIEALYQSLASERNAQQEVSP